MNKELTAQVLRDTLAPVRDFIVTVAGKPITKEHIVIDNVKCQVNISLLPQKEEVKDAT